MSKETEKSCLHQFAIVNVAAILIDYYTFGHLLGGCLLLPVPALGDRGEGEAEELGPRPPLILLGLHLDMAEG